MSFRCLCGRVVPESVTKAARAAGKPIACKVCGARMTVSELIDRAAAETAPETLARTDDPGTSHEAAEHMVTSGKLGKEQRRTSRAVAAHPGLTNTELSTAVGDKCTRRIGRRLPEVEKLGWVVRRGPRRCTITKRNAAIWYPA